MGAPRLLLEANEQQETADLDGTVTPRAFEFGSRPVRTAMRDGEPWFVAADVCAALEHSNSRKTVGALDDDEIGVTIGYTNWDPRQTAIINESGLCSLVFASCKPQAKVFRRWVTADVLPAIRRTGRYEASRPEGDDQARRHASFVQPVEVDQESLPIELVDVLVLLGLPRRMARTEAKAREFELVRSLMLQGLGRTSFLHPTTRRRVFARTSLDAWWSSCGMRMVRSLSSGSEPEA